MNQFVEADTRPHSMSEHDRPIVSAATNRSPLLLVVAVLVAAVVILHLTGVLGAGAH